MASLLPGYEYDIFISYRQNDNLTGGVTEFVQRLKEELAATLKESVSIYFDTDPHEGLLESHHVDKSLERKLKCLIFIPIISQTYCDPKSFAWQQEFCAFNRWAQQDGPGRDITLGNGNVASRILPIKIHDIDAEDTSVIETEIGGVLRSIDFIYKEAGVNRPLKPADIRGQNLNQTDYANQLNKVANAVKSILTGLRSQTTKAPKKEPTIINQPLPRKRPRSAVLSLIILTVVIAGYFVVQKLTLSQPATEVLDKSIAVLPFADMSPQKDQEYLGDGIAEEILNVLARVKDLKVIGRTSSFSYKGKGTDLKTIGEELGVSTILEGSIRKDGNKVRITAQFIKASDGSHLWSESYDRELKDIFLIQDELARSISKSLLISFEDNPGQGKTSEGPSNNEAYNLYLLGKYSFERPAKNDEDRKAIFYQSINFYKQSIALDSTFASSYAELARTYIFYSFFFGDQEIANVYYLGESNARKALELDDRNVQALLDMAMIKRNRDWDWEASRKYFQTAISIAPNDPLSFGLYAMLLSAINQTDSALYYANRSLVLDPNSEVAKFYSLRSLYYDRQFNEAISLSDQLQGDQIGFMSPPFFIIIRILSHVDKDKTVSILLNNSDLGDGDKDKLEKYYQENGWDALMKRLFADHLDSMSESRILITVHGAPMEAIFAKLNRDADNKVGELVYLLIDPVYDPIRSDPRYDQLLKRMGLDKYK